MKLREAKIPIPQFLLGCLAIAIVLIEAKRHGDFKVFTEAAKLLKDGQNMYSPWLDQHCCRYFYSPLFALLLVPFVKFPDYLVNFLWLSANVFFCVRIWKITLSYFNFSVFSVKEKRWFILITVLATVRFLLHNFEMIQMNVFILWSILESLNLIDKGKPIRGSFLLALAINIKILPIVFIPYLLLRKKFKPFLWVAVFSLLFLYLPALFIGFDFNNFMLSEWFKTLTSSNHELYDDVNLGGQSLSSLLIPLLMQTTGELPLKRNIANLDLTVIHYIITTVRVCFILLTFYFTGLTFFKEARTKFHECWEISYITLIIPLIFPHQEKYSFILIFPATVYIAYFLIFTKKDNRLNFSKKKWFMLTSLFCLSFILNTLSSNLFIGKYYNNICQHYRIITYGTLLLVAILAFCNPSVFSKNQRQEAL